MKKATAKEYMCSWCGKKEIRPSLKGKPMPGTCPMRSSGDKKRPHSWVLNRTL